MKKLDKFASWEMMQSWKRVRHEADDAIRELGGQSTDTHELQIDRIKAELAHALKYLDKGDISGAHLAIRDAIGHCEP